MRRLSHIISIVLALLSMVPPLVSCGPKEDPEIAVASVSVSQGSVTLEVGGSTNLTATVSPSNATQKTVTWSSSNQAVATVNNGTVTAVSPGTATITVMAGGKSGSCSVTVKIIDERELEIKEILMRFYDAMDGPNWTKQENWGTDERLGTWEGVEYSASTGQLSLKFKNAGLKGEIPECIGELEPLVSFILDDEPGITGGLPQSFAKLVNLQIIEIAGTSLTTIPDVFSGMNSLEAVFILNNRELSCPLPYSVGDSPALVSLRLSNNSFTGELPASWVRLGNGLSIFNNRLSGKVPQAFTYSDDIGAFVMNSWQQEGYGLDYSDVDIHGWQFWLEGPLEDLDGNLFSIDEVVRKNKYTVYINWAPWCPFSKSLMPQLRDYYNKYRQDGLEVIATVMFDEDGDFWRKPDEQKKEVVEKGYDQWYNYYYWADESKVNTYAMRTPVAEVYDQDGLILFSSFSSLKDTGRDRFGKVASSDLMPFLESIIGPAEDPDTYSSTDYSKDGDVMTLQTAKAGKGIDIVFMGDAYTDKDMETGGRYETLMKEAMEEFFSIEPYKSFRDRFNIYAVKVVSKNGRIGDGYSTALGTYFGSNTYVNGDKEKCYEYAMKVPGITSKDNLLVAVLVNTHRNSGTNFMSESTQSSVAFVSSGGDDRALFGPTLRHEAGGHGFAFLDDEYSTVNSAPSQSYIDDRNDKYQKYGWYANIDFTDDPAKVKWSAFLSDERYKDEIGIMEGGSTYAKGVYRPTQNSMMNENMEYYNAPSRWAIYKRIMRLSGEEASFEAFLEYDSANRDNKLSSAALRTRAGSEITRSGAKWEPGAPPVALP